MLSSVVATPSQLRSPVGVLATLTSALLMACKEDPAPTLALDDFCFEYARATCEGHEKCCDGMGYISGQECLDSVFDSCELSLLSDYERDASVTGPSVDFEFDEEGAAALVARVRAAFDRCEGAIEPTFDDVHRLSEIDGVCVTDADCVPSAACLTIGSSSEGGRCVDAPDEGEECTLHCAKRGNICRYDPDEAARVCGMPLEEGDECSASEQACAEGLFCPFCFDCPDNACKAFAEVGDSCSDRVNVDCGPDALCIEQDAQDPTSGECEASEPLSAFCYDALQLPAVRR